MAKQEELQKIMPYAIMPYDFRKKFPKCICVIECFEVCCDLMARAQTSHIHVYM